MSDSGDDAAEFLGLFQLITTELYITFALTALIAYEHVITFHQEVTVMWKRKWTGATVLFMMNRYLLLVATLLNALPSGPQRVYGFMSLRCDVIPRVTDALVLLLLVVFALFSAVRVYAIWNRNIFLFFLVLLPNLVPVGTNFYASVVFVPLWIGPPLNTCVLTDPVPPTIDARLVRATRISVIVADALVLFLTWAKTFKTAREAARLKLKVTLTTLLLRDGTIYFCVLLVVNILEICTADTTAAYISPFLTNLTPVLISRFMLNLRQVNEPEHRDEETVDRPFSRFSAPAFAIPASTLTGNLGADLEDPAFAQDWSTDAVTEDISLGSLQTPVEEYATTREEKDEFDGMGIQEIPA